MNEPNICGCDALTVSVIVVTVNRPDCVRRCLQALEGQQPQPEQVIVVDASRDDRTRCVASEFPHVHYLPKPELFGRMTASRNFGLMHATGSIVAYIDDDAYCRPGWLKSLLAAYDSPSVGAVGGRALNAQPGEEHQGREDIGRLKPNGFLTGHFAADPGRVIDADHIIGCNMSFRREVLAWLGGFRDDAWGTSGLCEDSDICLRVRALGYRLRFQPKACVDHAGAPQAVGRRFSILYEYQHRRNSAILLIRNFGFSTMVLRFPFAITRHMTWEFIRSIGKSSARFVASFAGLVVGLVTGMAIFARNGRAPERRDSGGETIRTALEVPVQSGSGAVKLAG